MLMGLGAAAVSHQYQALRHLPLFQPSFRKRKEKVND
jgi:hypothetical protein